MTELYSLFRLTIEMIVIASLEGENEKRIKSINGSSIFPKKVSQGEAISNSEAKRDCRALT